MHQERGFMDLPIRCSVNPEVGKPSRFSLNRQGSKRILVVGGGPGGMEAARILKVRGHDVTLWEKRAFWRPAPFCGNPVCKETELVLGIPRQQLHDLSIPYEFDRRLLLRIFSSLDRMSNSSYRCCSGLSAYSRSWPKREID